MISAGFFISSVQAQTSQPSQTGQTGQGGLLGMFFPMVMVFVIFYFLMIRPQAKQRKKHQELLKNLKKGDDVVTASGIHGKISGIADNLVTVEVAENVRIKMEKQQVALVKSPASS